MSQSDDLKNRPEEQASAPEAIEKQPLGFEQEVAPADPSLTGRRLFLKLALFGAAASMVPDALMAVVGNPAPESSPVALPYKSSLSLRDQPATLSDDKGPESTYVVSGDGDLYVDAAGNVFLSNLRATGTFVSGSLDVGPISIVQPAASMAGKYSGSAMSASTTVLYSDGTVKQQPATLRLNGTLAEGNGDLTIGVDFQRTAAPGSGVGVVVGFKKVTC